MNLFLDLLAPLAKALTLPRFRVKRWTNWSDSPEGKERRIMASVRSSATGRFFPDISNSFFFGRLHEISG
jgi:hypothetical protein